MDSSQIYRETDRCVKCGLCLPHCPTYLKLSDEAESPRGRISLIQAIVTHQLPLTDELQLHLDRCLGCRACELACPSGVSYGELIDAARVRIRTQRRRSAAGLSPWLLSIFSDRDRLKKYTRLLPTLQRSGILSLSQRIAPKKLKQLLNIAELLPEKMATAGLHPAGHPPIGKSLQLFIGCISSKADQPAIDAAIHVLTHLGYAIDISSKSACCGALYRHNGLPEVAEQLCRQNRKQTEASRSEALITLATACHLELVEHDASHLPVTDIVDFIINHIQTAPIKPSFTPLSRRVVVHTPCSSRKDQTIKLLRVIPELEVELLPENNICCGAAGSYLLTQPDLSRQFGQDKLAQLEITSPDILLTSNTGCALQFRLLIKREKLNIEVLHPIELIKRQLQVNSTKA